MTPQEQWLATTLARQLEVLRGLQLQAEAASDPIQRCRVWMALRRQAKLRRQSGRTTEPDSPMARSHFAALNEVVARAETELALFDVGQRSLAASGLGVRVGVVGKGGVGKTLVSSTLARVLARRGHNVLAADLDPNPGLSYGLGMALTDAGLPPEAIDGDEGSWMGQLAPGLHPLEAVEKFATVAPDGVRYLGLGKITDPERTAMRRTMGPLFHILLNFAEPGWDVVGDLEAGTNTPYQGYCYFADRVLLVVGPSWKSALTARRLLGLIGDLPYLVVGNRSRDEPDHHGFVPEVRIPFDPAVSEADRAGIALIDHAPESPAVRAIEGLADLLSGPYLQKEAQL